MYLEKHIQNLLETFRPLEMDLYDVKELLPVVESYVKRLEITELQPPTIYMVSILKAFEGQFYMRIMRH